MADDEYWHDRHERRPMDLGHGVRAGFYGLHGAPDDLKAGLIVSHVHDDGYICEGSVPFDIPENPNKDRPKWQVQSLDPVTISPSVLQRSGPNMTECLHGFIREGKWVPA